MKGFLLSYLFCSIFLCVGAIDIVEGDKLLNIINKQKPIDTKENENDRSITYRGYYIEEGENMKIKSESGAVLFSHFYIPLPYDRVNAILYGDNSEYEDAELLSRLVTMIPGYDCKGERERLCNKFALHCEWLLKLIIDYVLDNQSEVSRLIAENIELLKKIESGEVSCH